MKVRFIVDGAQYSLYALELGDEHDYARFRDEQRRNRPKDMATLICRLERLGEKGVSGKKQNFNYLGDGIWEAKTRGGLRVTFFQHGQCLFILDSCFAKNQPKTPPAEIDRASRRRDLFLSAASSDSETITILVPEGDNPRRKLL